MVPTVTENWRKIKTARSFSFSSTYALTNVITQQVAKQPKFAKKFGDDVPLLKLDDVATYDNQIANQSAKSLSSKKASKVTFS